MPQQLRQDSILKPFKVIRFPVKIGIIGGEMIDHLSRHFTAPILMHHIQISGKGIQTVTLQNLGHTAFDQHLFFLQIDTVFVTHILHNIGEFLILKPNQFFSPKPRV